MKPLHCFDRRNFRVESIDLDLIRPIIEENHYLHRVDGVVRSCFAIKKVDDSRLVGTLAFGEPVRPELSKSISPLVADTEITELQRVWIEDGHGSNIESWAIAQAFRMLPEEKKVVVSYADPSVGHIGRIYQALNGYYQELPVRDSHQISLDGIRWFHDRKQTRWFGGHSVEELKRKLSQNFWIRAEAHKYRYLWFLYPTKTKAQRERIQDILNSLKYTVAPYPKTTRERPKVRLITVVTE